MTQTPKNRIKKGLVNWSLRLVKISEKMSSTFDSWMDKKVEDENDNFHTTHKRYMSKREIDAFKYSIFLRYGFIVFIVFIIGIFLLGGTVL